MKTTHDGLAVLPEGAALPAGASGFTCCRLGPHGAYATWLAEDDRGRAKADYMRVEDEARTLRTKASAMAALERIGCDGHGTLSGMRLTYQIAMMRQLWPLRET